MGLIPKTEIAYVSFFKSLVVMCWRDGWRRWMMKAQRRVQFYLSTNVHDTFAVELYVGSHSHMKTRVPVSVKFHAFFHAHVFLQPLALEPPDHTKLDSRMPAEPISSTFCSRRRINSPTRYGPRSFRPKCVEPPEKPSWRTCSSMTPSLLAAAAAAKDERHRSLPLSSPSGDTFSKPPATSATAVVLHRRVQPSS